jgi:exopolysaccharide production protein ExoZ
MVSLERRIARRKIRWLERLGDISYSLYLSHVFSIGACSLLLAHRRLTGPWGEWLLAVLLISAALLVAELCYRGIEQPSRRMLRGRFGARMRIEPDVREPAAARG